MVAVFPLLATVMGAVMTTPLRFGCRRVPPAKVRLEVESRADVLPMASVPELTMVAPVCAFAPDRVSVPVLVLVNALDPVSAPLKVRVCDGSTLIVAGELRLTSFSRVQLAVLDKFPPLRMSSPEDRAKLLFVTNVPALTEVSPL